jgi:hypothetical protein
VLTLPIVLGARVSNRLARLLAQWSRHAGPPTCAAAAVEAAAQAAAAAERLRIEQEMAALTLRLQQMQAQLGVPQAGEEALCVVCLDAAKDRAVRPCMHVCVWRRARACCCWRGRRAAPCAGSSSSTSSGCSGSSSELHCPLEAVGRVLSWIHCSPHGG